MPTPLTRSPQRAAQVPASIPDDEDENAQPAEATPGQPEIGTTGGIVPQQGGEWWHAQPAPVQWSDDPQQRRQQSMAETDRRLSAHFQQLDPHAPAGWQSGPDARMYQYGLSQANQEYQQQAVAQRQDARDARNAANSKTLADFETRGVQHYTDPGSGLIKPIVDEQGRTLFHQTDWEQATHPKTGLPVLQKRDKYGQRQFKDLPVVPGLDPTDDKLYYKNPITGEATEAGAIADMATSPNYNVAKVALAANKRRLQAVHQQALAPMKEIVDATTDQLKGAQDQRDGLIQQLKSVSDLRDAQEPGSAAYNGYDTSAQQLQKQLGDVTASLKPDGQLSMNAGHARRQFDIARRKGVMEIYKAQQDEMGARLRSEGKDPATDPAYQANAGMMKAVSDSLPVEEQTQAQGAAPQAGAPAQGGQPSPLEQNEPYALFRSGQKSVGGVSLQSLAQRFGSGEGPVNPSSLLALQQRVSEINDTLNARTTPQSALSAAISNAPGSVRDVTQISGKLRKSLQDQRDYLDQLYTQRLARLPEDQQDAVKQAIDAQKTSAAGAFGRGAAVGGVGAGGAIAGGKVGELAGGLAGPYAPIAKPVLGVVGALVGSILADKGARALASKVAPDSYAKFQDLSAKDWEQHTLATTGGQVAANLAAFKPSSPNMAVRQLGALEKLAKGQVLTTAEKQAAQALAVQAGLAGGTAVGLPLIRGEKVDPMEVLAAAAQMMVFGESRVGGKGGAGAGERAKAEAEFARRTAEQATPDKTDVERFNEALQKIPGGPEAPRSGRSAEDVAGIFERNAPQTEEPQPPAKSAAEAAEALKAVPAGEYAPGEAAPSTAAEAASTIASEVPQVAPEQPPINSARESAAAILEGQARQEAAQSAEAQTAGRAHLGPEEGGQSSEQMAREAAMSPEAVEAELRQKAKSVGLTEAEQKEFEALLGESQHAGEQPAAAPTSNERANPEPVAPEPAVKAAELPSGEPAPEGGNAAAPETARGGQELRAERGPVSVESRPVEGGGLSHEIKRGGETVGQIDTFPNGDGTQGVALAKVKFQKQGIGSSAYVEINKQMAEKGERLASGPLSEMSPAARKLWQSLVRDDHAVANQGEAARGHAFEFKAPEERTAGRPPVVEQSPEATAQDRREYDMLQKRMSTLLKSGGKAAVDSEAYQSAWKRSEDIKNRHGGMPPEVAAAAPREESISAQPKESNALPEPSPETLGQQPKRTRSPRKQGGEGVEPSQQGAETPREGEAAPPVREEVAPSAEQKLNNADIGKKPVSALTPAEAAAELTEAGIKKTPKGVAIEDANSAQLKDAVGKLRRGELSAEGAKPGSEPRPMDSIIAKLEAMKRNKGKLPPGALGFVNSETGQQPRTPEQRLRDTAHDAALDLAILGIKAGRALADVVKIAVARFKARFPDATAEDVSNLTKAIHDAHGEPPEPTTPGGKSAGLVKKLGDKWKSFTSEQDLKDVISANRDAVEGKANQYAAEGRSEIADAIKRAEPDASKHATADNALRFFIESDGGKPDQLAAMRAKVEASEKADPKWKEKALAAIDYAAENGPKLKDAATRYQRIMAEQLGAEQAAGLPTLGTKNYVPRYQDVEDGSWLDPKRGTAQGGQNRKVRTFDTMADSIAAGIDPKTLSANDSLTARIKAGMAGVHLRSWQKALFDMNDPNTKEPVAVKPEMVDRADGTQYAQAPKGYDLEQLGGQQVAVKKEYSGLVSALTDPSWFSKNSATIALQKANAAAKSLTLMADTFHLGRLAFRSAMIRASKLGDMKLGPSYKGGLLLADHSPAEITRMAESGEIPKDKLPEYLENKSILDKGVKAGYNIGQVADNMHSELVQKMPVLSGINKFIFQQFQRGAMSDAYVLEYKRQKADNPTMTDDQVARKVSRELMTRFGNLGRQGLFKSKSAQDVMRLLFLAPQWNEGLIRSELGGVKDIAKAGLNAAQGKKATMGLLGREMLTTGVSLFVASQIINQATRGKFTWENPEEGWASKLSAWIPDKVGGSSGFFLNPMGLTAETAHVLMNSYERAHNTYQPIIDYARSRASSVMRPLATFALGKDSLGRDIKPGQRWKQTLSDAVPAPISGGSAYRVAKGLATGGSTEKYPGEFQKQGMQTFGLRTDLAPSPERRIQGLAADFNREHGKEEPASREVSDFQELTDSLRRGNQDDAKAAVETLLEKRSAEDLEKYYRLWQNRMFTGSHKNEALFLRGLNSEQRAQYAKARAERRRLGALALRAISAIPPGKRAGPFAPAP